MQAEEEAMNIIYGKIKRSTEKAVLLNNPHGEKWFPISQCEVFERAMGNIDGVDCPDWLIQKDAVVARMAEWRA